MKNNSLKKIFSILAVLALVLTVVLGTLAACKADHICGHVCPDCNKCTDATCTDPKCAEKCSCGPSVDTSKGKVYYVTPDAKISGADGTKENPYNVERLLGDNNVASRRILKAGDTVYVMPGTYKVANTITMSASGAHNNTIKIINAAYDVANSGYTGTDKRVVLDFSSQAFGSANRGVQLYGNYIYWYGIDVCGAGDNGLYIGGSYNTVEYCEFYNNRDTGLQLGRSNAEQFFVDEWPSYNLIKNCTSHNNYDNQTYGENADGFAAKLTVGYGNVFDGCIAYRNSDDGWDLYAKTDQGNIGAVIMYNCVAYENGFIEYTQKQFNKLFPSWAETEGAYSESKTDIYGLDSYSTRDGDGNGFKLGGSIMEGDVVMYNCMSYGNKMHGVTDNSNPGVISVTGVTSYNNSAAVDDNPESDYFGQIIDIPKNESDNSHESGNIDVSRQTYSYNILDRVLSVKDGMALSLGADAYRGAVTNSLLCNGTKSEMWNVIEGSVDADTKNDGLKFTSRMSNLKSSEIFEKLPVVKTVGEDATTYVFNLSGLADLGTYSEDGKLTLNADRAHVKYRNADGSINMGDILAVKDYTKLLGEDNKIGSILNLTSYGAYTHFADEKLVGNAESEIAAMLAKCKESLTLGTDINACYQDFDVLTKMINCFISWSSSNTAIIKLNEQYDVSVSNTEYVRAQVVRPADNDTKVTLKATISYLNQSVTKDFEINVKVDAPAIGNIFVTVAETGEVINNGGKLIVDINRQYGEPAVNVENGAYYNGTLLLDSQYSVKTTYKYSVTDSTAEKDFVEINGYTPNVAGVYKITHKVSLTGNEQATKEFTYKVYVASTDAQVDFLGGSTLTVNLDGYIISGALNSVTGSLYAVSSATELEVTADNIKATEGVKSYNFRDTSVKFQFENENSGKYYVYYALANVNGDVTSQVYKTEVKVVEISNAADFNKIAGGSPLGDEVPAETIYMLTKCLDFTGVTYTPGSNEFKGLLNGQGHTISNVTVPKQTATGKASLFYKVVGGTIENIKFDNITLDGAQTVGIVGMAYGGYFSNIAITNVSAKGSQRVGGLIGQVFEGVIPTYVDHVSVVNPIPALTDKGGVDETVEGTKYTIEANGTRAGGIIAYIQPSSDMKNDVIVYVSNCYTSSYVLTTSYSTGGIIGEFDDTKAENSGYEFRLEISGCLSNGVLVNTGTGRVGGMLGYQQGSGVLRISDCLSTGRHFYKYEEILTCQKNASGILGNYNTKADAVVTNCYAIMQEHNTDYDVQAYGRSYYTTERAYQDLKWDLTTEWTLVEDQIVTLNFLGEWTCECAVEAE